MGRRELWRASLAGVCTVDSLLPDWINRNWFSMELWPHHAFGYRTQGREPAAMVTESIVVVVAGMRVLLMHLASNAQAFVGTISPGHSVRLLIN